jgi:hypothetical protein
MTTLTDRRTGAPLLPPVLAYAVLTICAAAVPGLIAGVRPWTSDAALQAMYQDHPTAAKLGALFVVAAAAPLLVLTSVFAHRIGKAGLDVPGRLIALVGGTAAAVVLAASGMLQLAMTAPAVAHSLPLLTFGQGLSTALGGTAFAVFSGLLVAGVAVPGWLGRLLPRPLALTGLVIAVLAELGVLTTLTGSLGFLLPIARFGSLLWLIAAAVSLRTSPADR